jgi:hypothetical protein
MKNEDTKLRIVRLLEPSLCLSCRHANIATVEMANGTSRRMLHCKRLDCDNWQTEETEETPSHIHEGG